MSIENSPKEEKDIDECMKKEQTYEKCRCKSSVTVENPRKKRNGINPGLVIGVAAGACIGAAAVCAGIFMWKKKTVSTAAIAAKKAVDPMVKIAGTVAIPLAVKDGVAAFENGRFRVQEGQRDGEFARRADQIRERVRDVKNSNLAQMIGDGFEGRHYISLDEVFSKDNA